MNLNKTDQKHHTVRVVGLVVVGLAWIVAFSLQMAAALASPMCVSDSDCLGEASRCVHQVCECDVLFFHPPHRCDPNFVHSTNVLVLIQNAILAVFMCLLIYTAYLHPRHGQPPT